MVKAVIFDLDGTLINSLPAIAHYTNEAISAAGLPPIDTDRYRYLVGDGADKLIHRALAVYHSDTEENFVRVKRIYLELYHGDVLYKTYPYDGIINLLETLGELGIKKAVLSNKPDKTVKMIEKKLFDGMLDICMGKLDGSPAKPNPEGVHRICGNLGISADEAIFVGDTNIDIRTGKNALMKSIGVLWGFRDIDELKSAGADFIAKTPADILKFI